MWGYWFSRKNEFALSDVLDFVEGNILVWRADSDLVKIFLVPDLGGPLLISGVQHPPQLQGGLFNPYGQSNHHKIWCFDSIDIVQDHFSKGQ